MKQTLPSPGVDWRPISTIPPQGGPNPASSTGQFGVERNQLDTEGGPKDLVEKAQMDLAAKVAVQRRQFG